MADDIDPLSAALHSFGKDAIDVAVETVVAHFEARDMVLAGRAEDPLSFPGFGSTEPVVMSRRVVADLLNAGWQPPTDEEVAAAAERARQILEEYKTWVESLTEDEWDRAQAYFSEHETFPEDLNPPKTRHPQWPPR